MQILANLVMETLQPELREVIGPRLKGKMQQRQRNWMLVSSCFPAQVNRRHAKHRLDSNNQMFVVVPSLSQISDAVYRQVLSQTTNQYDALVEACEVQRVPLDARLRTDMDQIITSKEHVSGKIRGEQRHFCPFRFFQFTIEKCCISVSLRCKHREAMMYFA